MNTVLLYIKSRKVFVLGSDIIRGQEKTPLFDAVKKYVDDEVVQFHVPGHKQGRGIPELREYIGENALRMDANGMEDLDYINNPTGVIKESEDLFASAFGADESFFLVNGTTSGVQAMILGVCDPGSEIIIPRNAHKSAINGVILCGAVPVFIQPEINRELGIAMGVTAESMAETIREHRKAKAILIINPTYYGPCSDIRSITELAHRNNMAVLADEAHGTHFYFHPELPLPAMKAGADLSALSVHKTGGSMTQSSALLLRKGIVDPDRVRQALSLTFTSSASYVLMCSLELARKQLAVNGEKMLNKALSLSRGAREEINKIKGLSAFGKEMVGLPGCFDFDETKLGVNVTLLGRSGYSIESLLRKKYNIQIELSDLYNVLSIVTIGDREEELQALAGAFRDIAGESVIRKARRASDLPDTPKMTVLPHDAFYSPKRTVRLEASEGEIAGEMVMAYPPGIPVLCIGEKITKDIIDYIKILKEEKCELQGMSDPGVHYIKVLGAE